MKEQYHNDELRHYGVLGMKWGIRRARRKEAKATYKKALSDAKSKEEKAKAKAKYKQNLKRNVTKDAKIANKLYLTNSKELNKRIAEISTGKALCQSYLMTSYGALGYNSARVDRHASRGKAMVRGYIKGLSNNMMFGLPSLGDYLDNREVRKSNGSLN